MRPLTSHKLDLPKRVDVAVIGGGPAGLAAAKAITRVAPDATVKVLEATGGYYPQGAGVSIDINGWRALEALDPRLVPRLRARGTLIEGLHFRTKAGACIPGIEAPMAAQHSENMRAYGCTAVMLPWHEARRVLYEGLDDPAGTVAFNTRVLDCTPGQLQGDPARLLVQSTEQGAPAQEVEAGLVVVADGFLSRARKAVFGDNQVVNMRKVIWRALMDYESCSQSPDAVASVTLNGFSTSWLESQEGMPLRTALVYTVGLRRHVWTCIAPAADLQRLGLPETPSSPGEALQRVLAVFDCWAPELLDLLRLTDPSTCTEHGYFVHDMQSLQPGCWVRGNVVVVGDAAHAGPPDGQGFNQGLEDAAVLGAMLQQHGFSNKALEAWEAARIARVQIIYGERGFRKPQREAAIRNCSFTPVAMAVTKAQAA